MTSIQFETLHPGRATSGGRRLSGTETWLRRFARSILLAMMASRARAARRHLARHRMTALADQPLALSGSAGANLPFAR